MERIVALAKRRGFIFPGSEIYGGLNGFWDYGPLGVELKRNIKDAWWHDCVTTRDDMVGLDAAIIMNPKVWEASGHVRGFTDPRVDCTKCNARFRADQVYVVGYGKQGLSQQAMHDMVSKTTRLRKEMESLLASAESDEERVRLRQEYDQLITVEEEVLRPVVQKTVLADSGEQARIAARLTARQLKQVGDLPVIYSMALSHLKGPPGVWVRVWPKPDCPTCGEPACLTEARDFNLMFESYAGALKEEASKVYLRPETAQGIFVNYKNVLDTSRMKLPFGIAQIGKAFRNEINPRNYTFRSREFEQMEIEFFCRPEEADKWYATWRQARFDWYVGLGLKSDRLRLRDHEKDELAHYAKACADIEYAFPFGVAELEGVANRTDFDLKQHQKHPACIAKDLRYYDDETKERFLPYVIEPSGGVDRALLAFLCEAYDEDEAPDEKGKPQKRTVLRFHPRLAPIKVAVFPLVKKDGMPEKARAIYDECRRHLAAFYDEKGAVGRRYRRQDEAGTPFCVTVDGQTSEDGTVTIRDRDTMKQERIGADGVLGYVREHLHL